MAKNLFRVNLVQPRNKTQEAYERIGKSFRETDEALSEHIPVHVINIPCTDNIMTPYGCEQFVDWNSAIVAKEYIANNPVFQEYMKVIGITTPIYPHEVFSEGGLFVFGKEFVFMADVLEDKEMGLDNLKFPIYYLPSITCLEDHHIVNDYLIMDNIKTIFYNVNVTDEGEDPRKAREVIAKVAAEHGFETRVYETHDKEETMGMIDELPYTIKNNGIVFTPEIGNDKFLDVFRKINGINAIIDDNRLYTGFIHPKDRKYLASKGVEAVEIPTGLAGPGAGLHCIYAEFEL